MIVNILGILATIALGVSAYFAWETKGDLERQVGDIAMRENTLKETKKDNTGLQNDIKEDEEELAQKNSDREGLDSDLSKQNAAVAAVDSEIDDQKSTIESKQQVLTALEEETSGFGAAESLIADVTNDKAKIVELETNIGTETARKNGRENSSAGLLSYNTNKKSQIDLYSSSDSAPSMQTSISQVFNSYGYVILRGGDSVGIIKGSTLDVVRGGRMIAKLLVTTVEPGSAAADIIPSSVVENTTVVPGDKVMPGTPFVAKK